MLSLPSVTLLAADTANHRLALRALALSCRAIRFARVVFLTDALRAGIAAPAGVDVLPIGPLDSRDAYSNLMLKGLLPYVATPHVLIVQWDGYVIHPNAWSDAFLQHDYIGAKWAGPPPGFTVGNGGFSLRSRRLLEALQHPRIRLRDAEDVTICQAFRSSLESAYGIRFADEATADRFAFETTYPPGESFGFHGLYNFCRVMAPRELSDLASLFSDAIAASKHAVLLLDACVARGQWEAALAIARRILSARPGDVQIGMTMDEAVAGLAHDAAIKRNDPCPCRSGKRYKACHGAVAAR